MTITFSQRAVEAAKYSVLRVLSYDCHDPDEWRCPQNTEEMTNMCGDVVQAVISALAADGVAMVPVLDAASTSTSGCGCADRDYDDDIRDHWKAMLAAASEGEERR